MNWSMKGELIWPLKAQSQAPCSCNVALGVQAESRPCGGAVLGGQEGGSGQVVGRTGQGSGQ